MENENKLCVGAIVGVHGIKGDVKVKSFTQVEEDVATYGVLEDQHGRNFQIKVIGQSKGLLRVKVKGVDDRNQAETLIGTQLFVERDLLPNLEDEDEFYHVDLIGLDVKLASSDEVVGKVAGVFNFGSGELLELQINDVKATEVIPFNCSYVPKVNIKDGYIIVSSVSVTFDQDVVGEE